MGQGAYIFGCEATRLSPEEKRFFRESDPLGFIVFARNIRSKDQLYGLTSELREAVGRDAPILVDQEGGRVQRLTSPEWRQWRSPMRHVEMAGDAAERAMWIRYRLIADELRAVGIDVNCAPVADIASDETHEFLRNRCYAKTPDDVALIAQSVADGLLDGGVIPVVKHIPGHGRAVVDSHKKLPRVDADPEELHDLDFAPYKALADLPMGMTAHIVFEAFDDAPATTSPDMIRMIRDEIGFGGLLMTDDISMEALDGDVASRSHASIKAGCDAVLHSNGFIDEMDAIANVAGNLSVAGQGRADQALPLRGNQQDIDIEALEAELHDLMDGRTYV